MSSPLVEELRAACRAVSESQAEMFSLHRLKAVQSSPAFATKRYAPPIDNLQRLHTRISVVLDSGEQDFHFSPIEWMDVPWLAFWHWQGHPLCQNAIFLVELGRAAQSIAGVREHCVSAYLSGFDFRYEAGAGAFAAIIEKLLGSGSLRAWAALHERFALFDPQWGPRRAVAALHEERLPVSLCKQLDALGLSGTLAQGGFSLAMLLEWCLKVHHCPWDGLAGVVEWKRLCADALRSEDERIVEALLQPWLDKDPEPSWQQPLFDWLRGTYKEPGHPQDTVWERIGPRFLSVFQRWQTLATIESFFSTGDEYARCCGDVVMCRQWPFRQAFWMAYYRRGLVIEAKVAVGPAIEESLGQCRLRNRLGGNYARLEEFDAKQSALL
ncbi:MAG: hypothetical protein EOP84_28040, partial [Verrucomicrobiaceae bacterium]